MKSYFKIQASLFLLLCFLPSSVLAQDEYIYVDREFNYFYGVDEQIDIKVDVASLFKEDELVLGSTVSRITPDKWKQLGARRIHEAFNNEVSVMASPFTFGSYALNIRGYTSGSSHCGIAYLIDGVPLNEHRIGAGMFEISSWELGILNRIELIKGPGSAIYGSDAFSGVVSLKTFESEKDICRVEGAGAYPLYGDGAFQLSRGFGDGLVRVDAAASTSGQGDMDQEYEYEDNGVRGTGTRKWKYDSAAGVFKITIGQGKRYNIKLRGYINRFNGEDFPGSRAGLISLRENDVSSNESVFYMGNGTVSYEFRNKIMVEANGYHWLAESGIINMMGPAEDMFLTTERKFTRSGAGLTIKQPENSFNLQWLLAYSYGRYDIYDATFSVQAGEGNFLFEDEEEEFSDFVREIHSVFSQLKWGIMKDRLFLLLGGRVDDYSDFGRQVTPRGGIIFKPTEKSSLKALYGRAFRAPDITNRFGIIFLIKNNHDIKPETMDVYECAYIYKEKRWKASATLFYSYWKDGIVAEQMEDSAESYQGVYKNSGKNDAKGGELNFYGSFFDVWALETGFSYVTSRALDVEDESDPDVVRDRKYVAFPEYSINAGLHYAMKKHNLNFYLNNRLYLNMKEYPIEVKFSPDDLPPYYRVDLNIHKIFIDNLEMFLDIRNLLNRENRLPSIVGAEKGYEEPGTSVLLRAGYRF